MSVMNVLLAVVWLAQAAPASVAAPPVTTEALSQAYYLYLQAHEREEHDDLPGAIAAYQQAAALAPKSAEIHAALALAFARTGDADGTFKEAAAAIAIDPANTSARRTRGLVKADLADAAQDSRGPGLIKEAIEDLEVVIGDRLSDPIVDLTLGRLYVRAARYEKAIERLGMFLLDRPDHPEGRLLLADAHEGRQDLAAAVGALESIAVSRPDQARLSTRLADLQERTGRWKDAAGTWGRLADRNQRNVSYRMRQATALVNAGDAAAGRQALGVLAEQSPRDIAVWSLLAQVDRRAGDAARLEDDARHITDIDPADLRGPMAMAGAKAVRGDYRGAIAILEPRMRSVRPEDLASGSFAQMAAELAGAFGEVGDHKRAVAVLEDARRKDADNNGLLFSLGAAYDRAKRFDQAEQTFRALIVKEPENASALNYLGYMLADRGAKLDEAVTLITRALAVEADNPSFLDSLGWAYLKQTKLTAARDPLQRAASALPRVSVIQDHLAELYFQLKLYREAATAWDKALTGDKDGIDVGAISKKRDKARALADKP